MILITEGWQDGKAVRKHMYLGASRLVFGSKLTIYSMFDLEQCVYVYTHTHPHTHSLSVSMGTYFAGVYFSGLVLKIKAGNAFVNYKALKHILSSSL